MPDLRDPDDLDRECAGFAGYLTGLPVTEYVLEKYHDAHARQTRLDARAAATFDRWLISIARAHALGAWLADTYTSVFFKRALVRRKWILLVAILESVAPTAGLFDVPDPGGRGAFVARLGWRGLAFLVGLGISSVLFLPAHVVLSAMSRGEAGGR
jgi:hypothetical protein